MASNRLVVARGGVGIHPGALRKKISSNRGRAFSEPSLFDFIVIYSISGANSRINSQPDYEEAYRDTWHFLDLTPPTGASLGQHHWLDQHQR
jgi:hypothetical protein